MGAAWSTISRVLECSAREFFHLHTSIFQKGSEVAYIWTLMSSGNEKGRLRRGSLAFGSPVP